MSNAQYERPAPDPIAVELGALIHQTMWRKKITQAELGRAIGVSQSTAGKKIRGEVGITIPELMRIARLLGEEPGDLLNSLPRLDSNQQPCDFTSSQVGGGLLVAFNVVDLAHYRTERDLRIGQPALFEVLAR